MYALIDNLRNLTTFIPVQWLMFAPAMAAIIAIVICILIYRLANRHSVKKHNHPLYATRKMKVGAVAFIGSIGYAVGSALTFLYIFLWPKDPRWSGGFQGVDVPDMDTPDEAGGILGSSAVQRFIEVFTGGVNAFGDDLEGELNQALEPVILMDAYKHSFITAAPLLGHFLAGVLVAALLGALAFFWSQGAIPVKVYALEASVHRLKTQMTSMWSATKLFYVALRQLRRYSAYNTYCYVKLTEAINDGRPAELHRFEPTKDYVGWLSKSGLPTVPGEEEQRQLEELHQKNVSVPQKKKILSIGKR